MKTFIAMTAWMVLFTVLVLQFATEQANFAKRQTFNRHVNNAKEQAKQEGYFTADIIDELRTNIANDINGIEEGDLVVGPTTIINAGDRRIRTEEIPYEFGIPLIGLIVANDMFGISDTDNQMVYYQRGVTTSELVVP